MTTLKALDTIRIIDLSRVLAGPICTQILGDCGAEIIKVEKPGAGDDTRRWGPPFLRDQKNNNTDESAYYLSANRNKESITIDFTQTEGQELLHTLLEKADVLVENHKVGSLKKYGLGYDAVHKRHPHIIYASITGFGQYGPLSHEPGYDLLAQAMGGLMAYTGKADGPPMKAGVALSDVITGLYTCIGILSALQARQKTNIGQHIDISLLDCTLASMTNIAQYFLTSEKLPPRSGNAHSTIVPYQAFATKDGDIVIAVGNDAQFARLCQCLEKESWIESAQYSTNEARVQNRESLIPQIEKIIQSKKTEHWVEKLREKQVPVAPVNAMDDIFSLNHVLERDMKISMEHPHRDTPISLVGNPLKFSETAISYDKHPPTLGEHTHKILKDLLGLDEKEIAALHNKGVV